MSAAGDRLLTLVRAEPPDPAAIAAFLDGLGPAERREAITALAGPRLQGRLYAAVAGTPRVTLADLVPRETPALREVIFHGKNSLPAFTLFQKRFCRPPGERDELWGYNHQALAWLTGPGYFVVHDDPTGAAIDYREVPPAKPATWPPLRPNERGFSFFVYRDMVDHMRRVARDVFIGRAHRGGKPLDNYFVLARDG